MIVTHEFAMVNLDVPFDVTHCGTDRSLMTLLRDINRPVSMDTEVLGAYDTKLFVHRTIMTAFCPQFEKIKDLSVHVMDEYPIKLLMSLWDFMYCTSDSYDGKWKASMIPPLLDAGLLRC